MNWSRILVLLAAALLVTSCKLKIVVPQGGTVSSNSGDYNCSPEQPCKIEVVDTFFNETFTAVPAEGYQFHSWKKVENGLCGGSTEPCTLSTNGFDANPALMEVLESDQVYNLKPIFIKPSEQLRIFRQGDEIRYVGRISSEGADGSKTTADVTALREFFTTENIVDDEPVMLTQQTIRLDANGREFPEASFYLQRDSGAWIDVSDTAGNFLRDIDTVTIGVLGYPSPLVPMSKDVIDFQLLSSEDLTAVLAEGTMTIQVSNPKNITVPLGRYLAYKVKTTIKLEILVQESRGATVEVNQVHWMVPEIGAIKTTFTQREFDSDGSFTGTLSSELEAVEVNF